MPFVAMRIRRIRLSDFQLALMCGCDIPLATFQTVIHPLTMREIGMMGETEFFEATNYLCLEKEWITQDKIVLETYSNFQIFMMIMNGYARDHCKQQKRNAEHQHIPFIFSRKNTGKDPYAKRKQTNRHDHSKQALLQGKRRRIHPIKHFFKYLTHHISPPFPKDFCCSRFSSFLHACCSINSNTFFSALFISKSVISARISAKNKDISIPSITVRSN